MKKKVLKALVSTVAMVLVSDVLGIETACADDFVYNGSRDEYNALPEMTINNWRAVGTNSSASGNNITMSNENNLSQDDYNAPWSVIGGYNYNGSASDNKVVLTGGWIDNHVYGALLEGTGNANNNSVTISNTYIGGIVYGGLTVDGIANGNSVVINSAKFKGNPEVYGGYFYGSGVGGVINNSVTINSYDNVGGHIYGGWTRSGNASGNRVTIASKGPIKTTVGEVTGGYLDQSGYSSETATSAKGNSVNIEENTEVTGDIYGGQINSGFGTAGGTNEGDGNSVTITGATVGGNIYGGASSQGAALNNVVTITQSDANGDVYGGASFNSGEVSSNKILLTGGRANNVYGGSAVSGKVSDNIVKISDTTIGGDVIGGFSADGIVQSNEVIFSGGKVTEGITGGFGFKGDVKENRVTLSGNGVVKNVKGGLSANGGAIANSVAIEDTTVTGDVFGGKSSGNVATKNIVTLMGESVRISGSIYGGYDEAASSNDVFTGNTLNLTEFRGSMAGIYNFEKYNWVLPKDVVNNDALVHITGTNPVDLAKTSHTVSLLNDGNRLHVNDKITLIDKSKNGPDVPSLEVHQGNFIIYDMKLQQEKDGYVLTAVNVTDTSDNGGDNPGNELAGRINPRSKAFSEGRVASLGFLNQAADLIANSGIRSAKAAVLEGADKAWNMNLMPFLVIDGSSNRYKTGSHADVDGFNMAVGLASGFELAGKHAVTLGAFFEYGRGTYNTYNSFANYASVRGDGDTHYTGGGILGRIDFAGTGLGKVGKLEAGQNDGLYAEASLRAGHIDTDFDTNDILGIAGASSKYDSGADYFGLHGGVGYVMNFDERNSVDVYARYFWTKIDSETVTIGRDRLHFDDADSSRIRIGARYSMAYNQQFKPFVGVAYDHEFDGKIGAHAYNLKLDKPSLEGDTGIFEAGVSMKPISTIKALSVDISGQGFVGKRQGGGGGVKIKYQF